MTAPFRPLPHLAEARTHTVPAERLRALLAAAPRVRDALLDEGPVEGLASLKLITFPYPTVFAFSGAALSPAPYVMMTNRMMVVQYKDPDGVPRTLLFNPTDHLRGRVAPFYAKLRDRYGDFLSYKVMSTIHDTVETALARVGLTPEDVDYLAYDHLHIQDLRGWLGGDGTSALFPRAKLLVQRPEWSTIRDPHPMQRVWYVPDGAKGVSEDRVIFLDGDAWLGRGVAIVSTPGHTLGNMSLAVVADGGRGLYVTSENGVAPETYTPRESAIPGIRSGAELVGHEVVLNGNTREHSIEQYTSMMLEKALVDRAKSDPTFLNFYPSSELTPSLLAPGLSPTFSHGDVNSGQLRRPQAISRAA